MEENYVLIVACTWEIWKVEVRQRSYSWCRFSWQARSCRCKCRKAATVPGSVFQSLVIALWVSRESCGSGGGNFLTLGWSFSTVFLTSKFPVVSLWLLIRQLLLELCKHLIPYIKFQSVKNTESVSWTKFWLMGVWIGYLTWLDLKAVIFMVLPDNCMLIVAYSGKSYWISQLLNLSPGIKCPRNIGSGRLRDFH